MEETKKCPHCGVENAVSRVTCAVCHGKLKIPANNPSKESKEINPKEEPQQEKSPKKVGKKRRKSIYISNILFLIDDGKLRPIKIMIQVKKADSREVSREGKALLSLWNRNRNLISK